MRKQTNCFGDLKLFSGIISSNLFLYFFIVEYGTFVFETNMYQTDKYISKFTQFPVKVHIGENIYLQVRVHTNATGLSLLLDNCRATPSADPNDTDFHALIKDG